MDCEIEFKGVKSIIEELIIRDRHSRKRKFLIQLWERVEKKSQKGTDHATQRIEWISSQIQHEIHSKRNLTALSTERCRSAENRRRYANFSNRDVFLDKANFMPKKPQRIDIKEFVIKRSNNDLSFTRNFSCFVKNKQSIFKRRWGYLRNIDFISRKNKITREMRVASWEIWNIFFGSKKLSQSNARSVARNETFGKKNSRYLRTREKAQEQAKEFGNSQIRQKHRAKFTRCFLKAWKLVDY